MTKDGAFVGVSDHSGWAVAVTVSTDGALLDRRRINLLDEGLPRLPHHHEAQKLPLEEATALIERVRVSAERHSDLALAGMASSVGIPISAIAIRECPPLPPTVAERIADYRAQNVADTVMFRTALAEAAGGRGWAVHWYDARKVLESARAALEGENLDDRFRQIRDTIGPPWGHDQRIAMAAAIVVARGLETPRRK
jgi:hypothetical protein